MVSFENGKFVLRRRDPRLHSISRHRRITCRRVILISLVFSFFYFIHRRKIQSDNPDISLLRSASDANARPDQPLSSKDNGSGSDDANDEHDINQSSEDQDEEAKNECNVTLSNQFLTYLQTLDPIPKKVHMFFPDKNYWREEKPLQFVEHSILSLKRLNPDWNVTVYDDEMVDVVIRRAVDSNILEKEEADILTGVKDGEGNVIQDSAHIVERSDIARLLLMYTEGGIYLDADRLISKKIDDVIYPNTRMCLPTHEDANFCQDLICTSPRNQLFLSMIRGASTVRLQKERRKGWVDGGSLFDLGPPLYNTQIFIDVFGGDESTYDKCSSHLSGPRELLKGSDGVIVTKHERGCNDGFLVDDKLPHCVERSALYKKYKMVHWATGVDERWADPKE